MSKEKIDISIEELEIFFNKYDLIELDSFNLIFEYCYDYDTTDALKIARKVYKEKYTACTDEFEIPVRHMTFKTSDINVKDEIRHKLKKHSINHVTIELEDLKESCNEKSCKIKTNINHHHH